MPTRTPTTRRSVAALALGAVLLTGGAAAPAAGSQPPSPGGYLELSGDPLVHTFDLGRPGDSVTGEWTVTGGADRPVAFDGVLRPEADPDPSLAAALTVEYGRVRADGAVAGWHDAGTLAAPLSYADALGSEPVARAGDPVVIPVRVSLPDPALVTGEPGARAEVEAAFTVTYLPTAGVEGAQRLAITGAAPWWPAALAAAALAAGAALRSRRARPTAGRWPAGRRRPI